MKTVMLADRLFPHDAKNWVEAQKLRGLSVQLATAVDVEPGGCGNCGGGGQFDLYAYSPVKVTLADHYITTDNGRYEVSATQHYPCPACNEHEIKDQVRRCISGSGLQPNELGWSLAFYANKPGKAELLSYGRRKFKQFPNVIGFDCLYGSYGVGKSGVCKTITAELCKVGVRAIYTTMAHVVEQARATFSEDNGRDHLSEAGIIAYYDSAQLLVLDEVDRVNPTGWTREFIFTLLNKRYDRRFHVGTILATNTSPGQMGPAWEFLESRLKDGQRVIVGGGDMRGAK